jgi:hypothetical protein
VTRRTAFGTGALVAACFFLMQLAWILTLPPATGIDEFDHIHRAASVGAGHWGYSREEIDPKVGRGGLIPVPKDIVAATKPGCESFIYVGRANCNAYADADHGLVEIACAAARYNPLFYAVVGYPGSLFQGMTALTAMRVVTALLSAAMVGLGAIALRTWARTGWPLLGLFLAATPTVIYSSSVTSPNGLNIVSGLTLWAAFLGLLRFADDATSRRRLLTIATIAAVTLVNTHTLGLLWLALIVATVAIQRGRWALPRIPLPERRQVRARLVVVGLGVAFAATWILLARTNSPAQDRTTFHSQWWPQVLEVGLPLWPLQAIAAFPVRDEPAPLAVYAIGVTMMLALAVVAIRLLWRRRDRNSLLAIVFVAFLSYAIPVVLTAFTFRYIGLAWQGRYEMPFTGGLLLLFAFALDRTRLRLPVAVAAATMGLLAAMNVLGQRGVLHRFDGKRVVETLGWQAPSVALLALLALGSAVVGTVAIRSMGRGPGGSGPATSEAADAVAQTEAKEPVTAAPASAG